MGHEVHVTIWIIPNNCIFLYFICREAIHRPSVSPLIGFPKIAYGDNKFSRLVVAREMLMCYYSLFKSNKVCLWACNDVIIDMFPTFIRSNCSHLLTDVTLHQLDKEQER